MHKQKLALTKVKTKRELKKEVLLKQDSPDEFPALPGEGVGNLNGQEFITDTIQHKIYLKGIRD